jgi:hypothetical protein
MLINNVLPAIKDNFPCHSTNEILIQQDNATSHVRLNDEAITAKITELGVNINLTNQPPNSPDLNICDLSFFRAMQSMQLKIGSKNSAELIDAVEASFDAFPAQKIRNSFLTLQGCMNCILEDLGGNNYMIPHMGKQALERRGLLPTTLRGPQHVIDYWNGLHNNPLYDGADNNNNDRDNNNNNDGHDN